MNCFRNENIEPQNDLQHVNDVPNVEPMSKSILEDLHEFEQGTCKHSDGANDHAHTNVFI
jgi:hypothetical protein